MKGKLLLTRPGGGGKTEIRPDQRSAGWLVLDFEYAADGSREKTHEKRAATNEYVLDLLRQDKEFFKLLSELCRSLELQS